jgi:hypothetical protein
MSVHWVYFGISGIFLTKMLNISVDIFPTERILPAIRIISNAKSPSKSMLSVGSKRCKANRGSEGRLERMVRYFVP